MSSFKRRGLWLALPLVLGGLAWGLKWRADNPSSTKDDLRLRALMMKFPVTGISYSAVGPMNPKFYWMSKEELKPFVDSFHVVLPNERLNGSNQRWSEIVGVTFLLDKSRHNDRELVSVSIQIDIPTKQGNVHIYHPAKNEIYNLHPTTSKRWLELLLNHPRIGPELRRRMK